MREFMMMDEALAFTTPGDLEGALSGTVEVATTPLSSSWRHIKFIYHHQQTDLCTNPNRVCVCVRAPFHLSQVCEPPLRYDGPPPQLVDADVVGGRGHGGLQVVVVAERSSRHPDGELHPADARALYGCDTQTTPMTN